ncbi:Ger(x)C family spore germination protein [Brevibacillus fluminis]|uniref:Ger(x)C family spore germination protein n=1 Tax=Brevibacillus fluminis TaxID=511487 RepID=UPI001606009C|nr:Ger(x)C family spore germination protein [Brevibacillus fluminis]
MRKKIVLTVLVVLLALLTTGCWDLTLLKEVRLVLGTGLDEAPEGKTLVTYVIPDISLNKKNTIQVISTTGKNVRDARIHLAKLLTAVPDGSKSRYLLLGERVARKKIYTYLDVLYRDPKSALNAKIAVVKGRSSDFLLEEHKKKQGAIVNMDKQIVSAEAASIVPKVHVQAICTTMFDPGQDVIMPYLEMGKNGASVKGVALFNSQTMTGTLDTMHSIICNLLADHMGKRTIITLQTTNGKNLNDEMTLHILKRLRKLDVQVKKNHVYANVSLLLHVGIEEFPIDHLTETKRVAELAALLSKELTTHANDVIAKLQKANCDALGIGRQIIAYHHDYWKKVSWSKTYPTITIEPTVKVEISRPGIIF